MHLLESTYKNQSALATFCRTGVPTQMQGVNKKHIYRYRRLVLNVINDTLESAYPLTYNLLNEDEWEQVVDQFFSSQKCISPQLWKMPVEFYDYVKATQDPLKERYPFLADLLLFEWLEIEVYMMPDIIAGYQQQGSITHDRLVLNPEHTLQHFTYPVHLKKASEINTTDKGNYFVAIHRHPESGKVFFTNISAGLAMAIELLSAAPITYNELITQTCERAGIQRSKQLDDSFLHFINNALQTKLILGYSSI